MNSFNLMARWYFDRESGVALKRQLVSIGPPSADETKTGKAKWEVNHVAEEAIYLWLRTKQCTVMGHFIENAKV